MARSVLALVACMFLLALSWPPAEARAVAGDIQGPEDTHAPTRFDIDEQTLATALRAFSEQAGIAVLFDDVLVAGRRTAGIHGEATPRDALRVLLVGTGLDAHFSSMNAFTVTANGAPHDAAAAAGATQAAPPGMPMGDGDAATIQRAIEHALCARTATRPGSFRLAMQLWVDGSGAIADMAALAPSDDPVRDDKVLAAVRSVRLPARLSRFSPVTVLLSPSAPGVDPCRAIRAWEG